MNETSTKKPKKTIGCLIAIVIFIIVCAIGCHAIIGSGHDVPGIDEKIVTLDVRDDITGGWKYCTISEAADPEEYALDYYKACFEDGDTVHWIINFGNNTTTCIRGGSPLSVTVYERVDGEEKSAKTLGGGMVYSDFTVNTDTGEITKIQ